MPLWKNRFLAQTGFPRWASDAPHRLVYASAVSGRWQLHTRDMRDGRDCRVTHRPTGIAAGFLDPAGEWVWWFDDTCGDEIGVWRRTPFDARSPGPSTARPAAAPFEDQPAYSAGLLLGRQIVVIGSTTATGTTVRVTAADGTPGTSRTVYHHHEPAHVTGMSADESLLCVEHSEHGDSRHPALAVLDRQGARVADLSDGPGHALRSGDWSPQPGDSRLLVHHERAGVTRPALWDPLSGDRGDIEVALPGDIHAQWYPDAGQLLLHQRFRGRSHLHVYDILAGTSERLPLPRGSVEQAAVRPDGTVWALHSSGHQPARLLDGAAREVWPSNGSGPAGAPYQELLAGDVHCFVAEPPSAPRPHPTVFILHGGPANHDRDAFCPRVQGWVDHGFAAVLVNYRGSTGYGRQWRDCLQLGSGPGLSELEDLAAVRQRLIEENIADPGRIVLEGGSWGGYLALLALGRQPDLWQAGVAVVPVADWVAAYEDESPSERAHDRALFGGSPADRPEYYAERSPLTFVRQLEAPVYIARGIRDPHCPKRQIDNYLEELRAYGKTHEWCEFDGGHGSLDIGEQIEQHAQQVNFVSRHLATSPAAG